MQLLMTADSSLLPRRHPPTPTRRVKMSPRMPTDTQTHSDAEKGLIDAYSMRQADTTVVVSSQLSRPLGEKERDEKRQELVPALPYTKEKEAPIVAKPVVKPKKKVSKWVLWRLWFNTYR